MVRRIWIDTDIGKDPDDEQALCHALHMSHRYELAGLGLCWPGGYREKLDPILKAYALDYPKLKALGHTSPGLITNKVVLGCNKRDGLGQESKGVVRLIEAALAGPLLVLVWGSATNLANAIQQRPSIKQNIRAFAIGSWNREQDPESWRYLEQQDDLHWIACETSFRGIYAGWPPAANRKWVKEHVAPAGALGKLYAEISTTNVGSGALKMGDSPSLLWALTGDPENLGKASQGGKYSRVRGTQRYTDFQSEKLKIGNYRGAVTVARRRKEFLKDWQRVLEVMR